MDVRKYITDGSDFYQVTRLDEITAGRAILKAANIKENEIWREVRDNPQRNDENLKKDLAYLLGFAAGLSWIQSIPARQRII